MYKENINDSFILPIQYHQTTSINNNINSDLELLETQDPSNLPVYKHLFQPNTIVGNLMVNQWGKSFTNNIHFLKDSQILYKNFDISQNNVIIDNMTNDWNQIKNIEDIEEKYQYIEWDRLKFLNYNPILLHVLSFLNISSPIMQLVSPIICLFLPFLFLKLMGKNIDMGNYINILKQIIARNQLGQIIVNFNNVSIKTKLYGVVMLGFYLYSIYQNIISCYHFYLNSFYIVDKLNCMKNYLIYTKENICNLLSKTHNLKSYQEFNTRLELYKNKIDKIIEDLDYLPSKTKSLDTIKKFGMIMKEFYKIYYDEDIDNVMCFSFGFNGYIDCLNGLKKNIDCGNIHKSKFTNKNKCSFKNIYHPSLKDDSHVKNNINIDKSIIITGPNAAGKTTILKSTIINLIFTQQVGYGFYKEAQINPFKFIHSYINIPDSCSRDSLFQAEARRCKNILDNIDNNKNDRHFCVFDELYSGTNPYEAVSNAYGYLDYIIKNKNIKVILTTHYIQLCKLFRKNKNIKNCSMSTNFDKDAPIYNYKLIKGYSKTKGGTAVIKKLKYPKSIVDVAEKIIKKIN